jgi:hypothetical protein
MTLLLFYRYSRYRAFARNLFQIAIAGFSAFYNCYIIASDLKDLGAARCA